MAMTDAHLLWTVWYGAVSRIDHIGCMRSTNRSLRVNSVVTGQRLFLEYYCPSRYRYIGWNRVIVRAKIVKEK